MIDTRGWVSPIPHTVVVSADASRPWRSREVTTALARSASRDTSYPRIFAAMNPTMAMISTMKIAPTHMPA
jgi:hypothetical protein